MPTTDTIAEAIKKTFNTTRSLSPLFRQVRDKRIAGKVLMGRIDVSSNGHKAGEKPAFLFVHDRLKLGTTN